MSLFNYQYRPLPAIWPSGERTRYRTRARFRATWGKTMQDLERELRQLDVRYNATIIVEAGYQDHEIRVDGQPRANARPHDPAIIISFDSKHGPLRYGCDTYDDHLANLRAIALALEALRAVDRYGVTKRGEQYQGWKALPASSLSVEEARVFLRSQAMGDAEAMVDLGRAYRIAAKRLHPDVGGNRAMWDQLQKAKQVLGL